MMILVGPLFGPRRLGKREKAKQENLTAFSPLPNVQKNEESVTKLSMKSASSSKSSMKLNLNKKFNNTKSDNCAPKEFVIKTRDGVKEENNDEVISIIHLLILEFFHNFSIILISSTSEESNDVITLRQSSSSTDDFSTPIVYRKCSLR